jgi:manganese-dependent inorganic pyrophosphatase
MDNVFVVPHKSPDTDGVAAAIGYAFFKNKLEKTTKYKPVIPGKLNSETLFVLDKVKMKAPDSIDNLNGKKVILVDHNEMGQTVDGIEKAEVLEIVDHHKIGGMQTASPIMFHAEPIGSTCTIVADFLEYHKIECPDDIATLLLAGILSDTVIFKSPTTTEKDKGIASRLAKRLYIDTNAFGMDIKKAKASIKDLSANKVIMSDYKEFEKNGIKYGIGQIEVVDYSEAMIRKQELLRELDAVMSSEGQKLGLLMVTNIMEEATKLFVRGDYSIAKAAFGKDVKDSEIILPKVMSRKKQVVPEIEKALEKM